MNLPSLSLCSFCHIYSPTWLGSSSWRSSTSGMGVLWWTAGWNWTSRFPTTSPKPCAVCWRTCAAPRLIGLTSRSTVALWRSNQVRSSEVLAFILLFFHLFWCLRKNIHIYFSIFRVKLATGSFRFLSATNRLCSLLLLSQWCTKRLFYL